MNRNRYHELEIVPLQTARTIAPSTCARPAPRKHYPKSIAALVGAIAGCAVHIATVPAPIVVEPWGAGLVHIVGEDRWLVIQGDETIGECSASTRTRPTAGPRVTLRDVVRSGAHFTSTHPDIDVTWSQTCPE
jgi:hypothetical protein